jgi:hypothetical protein
MVFSEQYTTTNIIDKIIDAGLKDVECKKTVLSNDYYALCSMLETLINKLER